MTSSTTQKIHFRVESPANVTALCVNILIEKDKDFLSEYGYAYRHFINNDNLEKFVTNCIYEVLPKGGTITEEVIKTITNIVKNFVKNDEDCLEAQANHLKRTMNSWVYFKPFHKTYEAPFAHHADIALKCLREFFKGQKEIDLLYFKNFIFANFEVKSDNTTVNTLVGDAEYMLREILWANEARR